jgi:hypothetical protein
MAKTLRELFVTQVLTNTNKTAAASVVGAENPYDAKVNTNNSPMQSNFSDIKVKNPLYTSFTAKQADDIIAKPFYASDLRTTPNQSMILNSFLTEKLPNSDKLAKDKYDIRNPMLNDLTGYSNNIVNGGNVSIPTQPSLWAYTKLRNGLAKTGISPATKETFLEETVGGLAALHTLSIPVVYGKDTPKQIAGQTLGISTLDVIDMNLSKTTPPELDMNHFSKSLLKALKDGSNPDSSVSKPLGSYPTSLLTPFGSLRYKIGETPTMGDITKRDTILKPFNSDGFYDDALYYLSLSEPHTQTKLAIGITKHFTNSIYTSDNLYSSNVSGYTSGNDTSLLMAFYDAVLKNKSNPLKPAYNYDKNLDNSEYGRTFGDSAIPKLDLIELKDKYSPKAKLLMYSVKSDADYATTYFSSSKANGTIFDNVSNDENALTKDFILIKFAKIGEPDAGSDSTLYFPATITGLQETSTPSWDSNRFIGNPFNYYNYTGVERSISFDFTVYSNNSSQHRQMWTRVSALTSLVYPSSYTENASAVVAPIIKVTIGDLYKNKICIIDSLNWSMEDNAGWEIGKLPLSAGGATTDVEKYTLPRMIKVSVSLKFLESRNNTTTKTGTNALYNFG